MVVTDIKYFRSRYEVIRGSDYLEVYHKAHKVYAEIARTTKRNPYVRSAYFGGEKVFLKPQWDHIYQKNNADRRRRLRYYAAAIDLIKNTRCDPVEILASGEQRFRFYGETRSGDKFIVQIRKDKDNGKYHMSQFPPQHHK